MIYVLKMLELYMIILLTIATESEGFDKVDVLTVEQRREIFGTNTTVNLPPIELVTLQRLRASHSRKFGKRPYNILQYRLTRNGQQITLTLRQNTDFLSPGCFVHHYRRNGTVNMYPCASDTLGCFYTGHSDSSTGHSDPSNGTWITVNACQGLKGIISISNTSYVIAPLHPKAIRNHDNDTHIHVVYRYRSEKTVCRTPEPPRAPVLHIVHRNKRGVQDVLQTRYVEARAVIDPSMYAFHQDKAEDYVLTLFNIASSAYEDHSLGTNIKLVLTEILIYHSYDSIGVELTTDANKTVIDACKWLADNVTSTNPDCNVLLTRLDIEDNGNNNTVGLAQPYSMCKTGSNCAIVEDIGLASGTVMAHEIGHILGMHHDEDTSCANMTGIMTRVVTGGTQYTWSKCSGRALREFLGTSGSACLLNQPSGEHQFKGFNIGRPLPGTVFTKDQQCKLLVGKQASYCANDTQKDMNKLCSKMVCRKHTTDEHCVEYSTGFADGTDCNNTRSWCISGKYVAMNANSSVPPVNGIWTDWDTDYSPCTRTCGGGVKLKRRTCTNPPPQFGGAPCVGENVKAIMCNMQRCVRDYKETQCSEELDHKIIYGVHYTWVPVTFSIGNDSCVISCMTRGNVTRVATLRSPFKDGTECPAVPEVPYGRCIDGACRAFGCDGGMESGMVYDQCGICNGTGLGCQEVVGHYSAAVVAKHFTTIQVIPRDSFRIKIRQYNMNCFLSARINGQRIFNDDPRNRRSHTYVIDGVTLKYTRFPESLQIIGPTTYDMEVQVYSLTNSSNPQVQYEYYRAVDQRILQYTWATRDTGCSKPCGTGMTTPIVQCVDFYGPVEDFFCDLSKKPNELQRPCNTHFCPSAWKIGALEPCSKTCGPGGYRKRRIYCAKENNGTEVVVPAAVCHTDGSTQPPSIVNCTNNPCPGVWKPGRWTQCSMTCGLGIQIRTVDCYQNLNETTPVKDRLCEQERPPDHQECRVRICQPNIPAVKSIAAAPKNYEGGISTVSSVCETQDNCTDLWKNCSRYGKNACYGDYHRWAEYTCRKFCEICSGDDPRCSTQYAANYGGAAMCKRYPEWAKLTCPLYCGNKVSLECKDKPNCVFIRTMAEDRGEDICQSTDYRQFVNKNCRKFCNLCSNATDTNTNNCGNPTPTNGVSNSTDFTTYGSVIEITCNAGYVLTGSSVIKCQENGRWSDSPSCGSVDCGDPTPNNGQSNTPTGTTIGQNATISCDDGYHLDGDSEISCLSSGSWSSSPTCSLKDQCVDKKSNCAGYTAAPCKTPIYVPFMRANCAKFCGFC